MATTDEIRKHVMEIVAEVAELPVDKIKPDAMLVDLDVDSLRGLRIVAEVEKRYRVVITETEIGEIRSMQDIFALVEEKTPRE